MFVAGCYSTSGTQGPGAAMPGQEGWPAQAFRISAKGLMANVTISYPQGWNAISPSDERVVAMSGQYPDVMFVVTPIPKSAPGNEQLLNGDGGLQRWVSAAQPGAQLTGIGRIPVLGAEGEYAELNNQFNGRPMRVFMAKGQTNSLNVVMQASVPVEQAEALKPLFTRMMMNVIVQGP